MIPTNNINLKDLPGEDSTSQENRIFFSNCLFNQIDFLIFFDSRGLTTNENSYHNTILNNLMLKLKNEKKSFIIVSRPKNLTVFATLYNFLKANSHLQFSNLITNLGFVDYTPKKYNNVVDILSQINFCNNFVTKNKIIDHEIYILNNGERELLKSIEYSEQYITKLVKLLNASFVNLYFLNSPIIDSEYEIERARPKTFFSQLHASNELVKNINSLCIGNSKLINIEEFSLTYDGVHYTSEGHKKILKKILKDINL